MFAFHESLNTSMDKFELNYESVINYIYFYYFRLHKFPFDYLSILRDLVFLYFIYNYLSQVVLFIKGYGIVKSISITYKTLSKKVFSIIMGLPFVSKKVNQELQAVIEKMEHELMKNDEKLLQFPSLPNKGLSSEIIRRELDNLQSLKHSEWTEGRVSGAVYHGGKELLELQSDAYHKYSIANQLHPDVFPAVRKMESEVVSMVLNVFNAPPEACGSTTSGGTESLLLAGLSAREFGKKYKHIRHPEVIAPITVHAGIEKACYYFGMKLHKVEVDKTTYQVDILRVKKLINSNTVLLVGSAPNFPHGIIDDIEALSSLALKYNIPLHVDACLGSFIVSFLEKSAVHGSRPIPKFDFRVPGVTSISCDTHKYGFAPKGSSVIMYRNSKLRECQYYVQSDWTGGMYGSPTLAGSRPGALMVGCWATMVNYGEDGYIESCREIVGTAQRLKKTIKEDLLLKKYLEVIGDPIASVIAFKVRPEYSKLFNIYQVSDGLNEKGWHFSALQNPAAIHFACTRLTVPVLDVLIDDLKQTISTLLETENSEVDQKDESQTATLYGVAGSVKTAGVADKLIVAFLDTLYKV